MDEAKRLAMTIERKATVLGPRGAKKTMLARQALAEMNEGGSVTRKTMLALEDCARLAEEMPMP
jgi:type II secretory pathway predicted ATPase ExeA